MTFHLTAVQLLAGIGVPLTLLIVWRAGVRLGDHESDGGQRCPCT
jgi:hypothetical protein